MQIRLTIPALTESELVRFWAKVIKTDSCWLWAGTLVKGYGHFKVRGRIYRATRIMLALQGSHSDLEVCHACNNPTCVNPAHLSFGSAKRNAEDRELAGRTVRGEKQWFSKLTSEDVVLIRELRNSGVTRSEVAKRFKVTPQAITSITSRVNWKHL